MASSRWDTGTLPFSRSPALSMRSRTRAAMGSDPLAISTAWLMAFVMSGEPSFAICTPTSWRRTPVALAGETFLA